MPPSIVMNSWRPMPNMGGPSLRDCRTISVPHSAQRVLWTSLNCSERRRPLPRRPTPQLGEPRKSQARRPVRAFPGDCGVSYGMWKRSNILRLALDVLGPLGVAAIAVALLVIAVEAARLLLE